MVLFSNKVPSLDSAIKSFLDDAALSLSNMSSSINSNTLASFFSLCNQAYPFMRQSSVLSFFCWISFSVDFAFLAVLFLSILIQFAIQPKKKKKAVSETRTYEAIYLHLICPLCVVFQVMTAHHRWEAFRGDSTDAKDLLFSVKKSSFFQIKTELDVFFSTNTSEDVCDLKIKGSYFERACTIFQGNSDVIVAQVKSLGP